MLVAVALVLAVSGCSAATSEPTPTPTSTLPPGVQDVPLAEWRPEPAPSDDDRMRYPCDAGAEPTPFGCVLYTSTSGSDGAEPMPWLTSLPLLVRFSPPMNPEYDNGANLAIGVATPCNALNISLLLDGDTLTPTVAGPMMTLMGCMGATAAAETWATDFISRPMTFTLDGSTLVLRSDDDEVTFEATPIP
ncbi:META domain-containing protein [Microbacteriaceae bacterium VKM Ac-2854]|nr:META domain-containing protein [Microbacteriaceae bacterium VKM Ac-2854]